MAARAGRVRCRAIALLVNVEAMGPGVRPLMRATTTTLSPSWRKLTVPLAELPLVGLITASAEGPLCRRRRRRPAAQPVELRPASGTFHLLILLSLLICCWL